MVKGRQEIWREPVPLTRQAIVQHHDPFGEPCPKVSVVQVYTFVPSREIVRVKATCSRCLDT